MIVFLLLSLLVAMVSGGGVLVTLTSCWDSGGYLLTFAGSSVVQSETLFVYDVLTMINGYFCGQNVSECVKSFSFPANGAQPT